MVERSASSASFMSIVVVDADAIMAQPDAPRVAIIPPTARDPSISECIVFMVVTSLGRTSLSRGRQSSAIPCAMHASSEPNQYRTVLSLDRPVPAGTDPGGRARLDVGSVWLFRFATMTESITSPHNRHCHPEMDSPLTTSFILMICRNPSQREQIMPITWLLPPLDTFFSARDLVRFIEPTHRCGRQPGNRHCAVPARETRRLRDLVVTHTTDHESKTPDRGAAETGESDAQEGITTREG